MRTKQKLVFHVKSANFLVHCRLSSFFVFGVGGNENDQGVLVMSILRCVIDEHMERRGFVVYRQRRE